MAPPDSLRPRERKSKTLAQRACSAVNPDFGYLNSQRRRMRVPTGNSNSHSPILSTIPSVVPGRLKRARIEVAAVKTEEDCGPALGEPSQSASPSLRIAQLQNEVAVLRAQIRVNQETMDRFIGMQHDWEDLRQTFGGLSVRMNRVEGHIDEIVEHLPAHYGGKSEIGSDFDPDATIEVEGWSDVSVKKEEF
ncbi:hypothetical protein B0H14DRAFT_2703098 [Mycena olivaceomarginata]|nr:hypothetical protein B0H14DRAFT_2703098 [Mycena olivaceomarginata]